ncbi:hypothetical protein IEU95_02195 [Hoyosella rhizosphaerae]|uniref:Uncharacterized protein n=1 Tax=Hoyosella rhizosphaerae TaxID=1755582 RepID=A0A916UEA5_9ACTN|nr:hypothetical protein [Hoyosella rhizosphaerae]MBN4925625.1 hypothetical protein [Hoyosella rhizosphaerae]GGC69171.1 hypothetical protein GCM10011410_22490 [Hoyosella rhizosphaerae]
MTTPEDDNKDQAQDTGENQPEGEKKRPSVIDQARDIAMTSLDKSGEIVDGSGDILQGKVADGTGKIIKGITDISTNAASKGAAIITDRIPRPGKKKK